MATSSRLFIGNVNYKTNAETIGHLFETIGEVDNVKISCKNGISLGYGFIEMADVESAQRAQFELNRHILDGRQIRVEFAKERKMKKFQKSSKLNKINKSYDNVQIEKKAIPNYQLDQLHQIIQDIHSNIESNKINDEEKVMKIIEIYNELKKKELEHGIQRYNSWYDPWKDYSLFDDIESSGLLNKIELMIKDKIEEEKEQMKYSDETEQLIRIQIQIMTGRQYDQEMIDICIKVIEKNINNLLKTINKLKEENNKGNKNEQENEVMEREIKQSEKLIKVCSLFGEYDRGSGTRIPDQIIQIVKQRIVPLIHHNCPSNINCQQYINIPQYPALLELKSVVFQTLNQVLQINQGFKKILVNDHNIIAHLTHPLIQFVSQSQFNKKSDSQEQQNQYQSESSSFISLITSSLELLCNLINNNDNIYKELINITKALHSLTTLSTYKINIHLSQENDQQTLAIRSGSRKCLLNIHCSSDASAQSELVNANYTGVLVIAISTASGSGEEQDEQISIRLGNISTFLNCLNKGGKYYIKTFPPQPLLAHRSDEQIEEEGGNEEIDSQLINKGKGHFDYDDIKNSANRAQGEILNYFIEQGNQRPYWY